MMATTKYIEITTDYLIVGAGALGMGFLEEIIVNDKNLKAVIVDMRDKVGLLSAKLRSKCMF